LIQGRHSSLKVSEYSGSVLRTVVFVLGSKKEECSGYIAGSSLKSDLAVVMRVHFVCSPIPIGSTEDMGRNVRHFELRGFHK